MLPQKLDEEFKNVISDIVLCVSHLNNPHDRVRIVQWIRRLRELNLENYDIAKIRNDYIHYMKLILESKLTVLPPPFDQRPPDGEIASLFEILANHMADKCYGLPKTGPIIPIMYHKTDDDRAIIKVQRCPGGVLCYLAVTSHPFRM